MLLLDVPVDSRAEREILEALIEHSPSVLATVPTGDDRTLEAIAAWGAPERICPSVKEPSSLVRLRDFVFSAAQPPQGESDEAVRFFSAPGEGRECVEIARWVLDEARQGVTFDQIADRVARFGTLYSGLLENALRRANVPAYFARGTKRPDPSGRAFLALLACAVEGLSAKRFSEYLSLGQVPALEAGGVPPENREVWTAPEDEALGPAGETARSVKNAEDNQVDAESQIDADDVPVVAGTLRAPWKWEELLVEAAVIGMQAGPGWIRRWDGLANELRLHIEETEEEEPESPRLDAIRRELTNLGHLRRFALPVIEMLDAFPEETTWGEWLTILQRIGPMVLRRPQRVLTVIAELQPMAAVGPVSLDEVREVLAERLLTLEEEPPERRYGRIFVATPDQMRSRTFDVVFVPGLAERIFPQKPQEDPMLLDTLRTHLGMGMVTQEDRGRRERLQLLLATGAARKRVYLSYPRIEVAEARQRVPSFYGLDVERAIRGRVPDFEELESATAKVSQARLPWPAPNDPARAIDDVEHDLAVLGRLLRETNPSRVKGRARYLFELNSDLARSLRSRWARWESKAWSPADGLVKVTDATKTILAQYRLTARPYSVSALQKFAACPYRFLLSAVHRLEPRKESIALERLDPLTRGRILHQIQAELFRELARTRLLPVSASTLADALAKLDETLVRVSEEYREELAPAIPRVWQDENDALRADLRAWLQRVVEIHDGWEPVRFEFGFGLPPDGDRDPRSISEPVTLPGGFKLRGAVDLIERRANSTELRVTDHKTGKDRTSAGLIVGGGATLQPVLYSLAVEAAMGDPVAEGRLFFCTSAGNFAEHVVKADAERSTLAGTSGSDGVRPGDRNRFSATCSRGRCLRVVRLPRSLWPVRGTTRETQRCAIAWRAPAAAGAAVTLLVDAKERELIRTALDCSMFVEAAAGTGKTTELLHRIVAVLADGRTTVDRIVAVTFTEKAAGELKLRLRFGLESARRESPVGSPHRTNVENALAHLEEAHINTIHGFCADLLRERPVEAEVDPRFQVMTDPEAMRLCTEAFDLWLQEQLEHPPEGVRRALRRASSFRVDDSTTARLRDAAWTLIIWRDFPAQWRREPFARQAAIDSLVQQLESFAMLTTRATNRNDNLLRDTWQARQLVDQIRTIETARSRDYDGLESSLIELGRERNFVSPRKGYGTSYGNALARAAVLAAHEELVANLKAFARAADADLAALLQGELFQTVERYEELKQRSGRLDFVDLLIRARNLVRDCASVRSDLQRRLTHIFVDEFQDTDPLQAEIILLLASDDPSVRAWREVKPAAGKLFIVGDPKQAIYRFRRADVGVYREVKKLLEARGSLPVQLTTSFRGVPSLQNAVNAAFAPVMTGDAATLQADFVPLSPRRTDPSGQPTLIALSVPEPYGRQRVAMASIENSLPDAVGAFVQWLLNDSKWTVTERERPDERVAILERHICLLFRRFDNWGEDITRGYARALEARGIPHLLVGGKSFHGREEVETMRAALSAIEWPDDELSVFATLHGSLFAIDDETLLTYRHQFRRLHPFRIPEGLPEMLAPVGDALRLLQSLHRARNYRPVSDTIGLLLETTRAHAAFVLRPSGEQALANVLHIAELARTYETSGGISFRGFVEQLRQDAEGGQAPEAPILEEGSDGVRIMTVHKAKGLEFPVVILADITAKLKRAQASRYIDAERNLCAGTD